MLSVEVNCRVVVLVHLTLHFEVYSIPSIRKSDPHFQHFLTYIHYSVPVKVFAFQ